MRMSSEQAQANSSFAASFAVFILLGFHSATAYIIPHNMGCSMAMDEGVRSFLYLRRAETLGGFTVVGDHGKTIGGVDRRSRAPTISAGHGDTSYKIEEAEYRGRVLLFYSLASSLQFVRSQRCERKGTSLLLKKVVNFIGCNAMPS